MQLLTEVYSSAIFILEVLAIAILGAIVYRNVSLDEWEDNMNLAPLPPCAAIGARKGPSPTMSREWLSQLPR